MPDPARLAQAAEDRRPLTFASALLQRRGSVRSEPHSRDSVDVHNTTTASAGTVVPQGPHRVLRLGAPTTSPTRGGHQQATSMSGPDLHRTATAAELSRAPRGFASSASDLSRLQRIDDNWSVLLARPANTFNSLLICRNPQARRHTATAFRPARGRRRCPRPKIRAALQQLANLNICTIIRYTYLDAGRVWTLRPPGQHGAQGC